MSTLAVETEHYARTVSKILAACTSGPEPVGGFDREAVLSVAPWLSRPIERAVSEGLFVRSSESFHWMTPTRDAEAVAELAHLLDIARRSNDTPAAHDQVRALWALTLLYGHAVEFIGGSNVTSPFGSRGQVLHLMQCGVNTDISPIPGLGSWMVLDRGRGLEKQFSGLLGVGTCVCGQVVAQRVGFALEDDSELEELLEFARGMH